MNRSALALAALLAAAPAAADTGAPLPPAAAAQPEPGAAEPPQSMLQERPADAGATPLVPTPAGPPADATRNTTQSQCRTVLVARGVRETVAANVAVATRIELPGEIANIAVSVPGFWDSAFKGDSVWVRPRTAVPEAQNTGLSAILADGRKYDFLVNREEAVPQSCVIVRDMQESPPRQAAQATARGTGRRGPSREEQERALAAMMDQQRAYEAQLQEMRRQVEQQASDRIKAFQYSINTRYRWDGKKGDGAAADLVTAVYDDGRFTYVRVATSAFGLPSLSGELGDKDVVLQYDYDDLTGVFTVQGLYDRIRVRIGSHEISVRREG
jgi:hypothetical protein